MHKRNKPISRIYYTIFGIIWYSIADIIDDLMFVYMFIKFNLS